MKNLFKSLAAFQQECPAIHKGTSGYGYTYADLPAILEIINPLLAKHKLGFTQLVEGESIKTIVFHTESGEMLETTTAIPQGVTLKGMNEYQIAGSAITYFRRYALSAILGIVTDKDNDAAGEQVTQTKAPAKRPTLDDARFTKLLASIKAGTYTVEKAKANFSLTTTQLAQL